VIRIGDRDPKDLLRRDLLSGNLCASSLNNDDILLSETHVTISVYSCTLVLHDK
jgi:hypothetical protein